MEGGRKEILLQISSMRNGIQISTTGKEREGEGNVRPTRSKRFLTRNIKDPQITFPLGNLNRIISSLCSPFLPISLAVYCNVPCGD